MDEPGVGVGRLLLALDATLASLAAAPRGLDVTISSVALIDPDDLHLPPHASARDADLFLMVGVDPADVVVWLDKPGVRLPVAVMLKSPPPEVVSRLDELSVAVIDVDPHARWERIYRLVLRVLDAAAAAPGAESMQAGSIGDLFELAGEVARRTGGLVSIEDARSHVLAYSSAGDEADELRRLSILGREGPAEMLAWLRQWGVLDALRTTDAPVPVAERHELGLRPRLAISIRTPHGDGSGEFLGAIWLQQGREPFADNTSDILRGAAAVAARIIARRRSAGSGHDDLVRRLLGARGDTIDATFLGTQLGMRPDADMHVVAFGGLNSDSSNASGTGWSKAFGTGPTPAMVSALTLHASAFSPLSVTTTLGPRAYVVLPDAEQEPTVAWAGSAVAAARRQFGVDARAVVAGPDAGLASVHALRTQGDRVLDAAQRESDLIEPVTTVAASTTGVLLGEIVALIEDNPELIDARVLDLAQRDEESGSDLTKSLRAYLDHFGDVRAAADALHVHPNTLRYRIRRVHELTGIDLDDPATRLVVALTLRVPR
ncbi:PucR family transcriptional regulator [Gordonia aichiensis]|uniref:PucR family transcriptional regulator n=1 Tax=Gordonia aichiensis TaxID=36820 RepID=UPI00058B6318|nr:helix-turn-helix domain-containing protein [Gordonia aichiensis]